MNIEIHDEQYLNQNFTDFIITDNIMYVGDYAFSLNTELSAVTVGKSVNYLGENCFERCINLKHVEFKTNMITKIQPFTFAFCINLESIILPEGITEIGESAFECCHNLTHVHIPSTCTTIDYRAFFKCNSIKTIQFNSNINLASQAFMWCDNLITINSDKIQTLYYDTFKCCTALNKIYLNSYENFRTLD